MNRKNDRGSISEEDGSAFNGPASSEPVTRKHLITAMLKDRSVLRMLCAPSGYGKTTLAHEYEREVFDEKDVLEIKGDDPSFLCALDRGTIPGIESAEEDGTRLVVIDDLVLLDETRSKTCSDIIDGLLENNCEVIVASTPSNDCLGSLQPDRITISPRELMVDQKEYEESIAMPGVRHMPSDFLPHLHGIPSLIWTSSSDAAADCMRAFFAEKLPQEIMVPAELMFLLGEGSFSDLSMIGVKVNAEVRRIFERSYPLLGVDLHGDTFRTIDVSIVDIARIEADLPVAWTSCRGLLDGVVDVLMDRGDDLRAAEMVTRLAPDAIRYRWLVQNGWRLLDRCEPSRVRTILKSLGDGSGMRRPEIAALDAWTYYLSGNLYGVSLVCTSLDADEAGSPQAAALRILKSVVESETSAPDAVLHSLEDIPHPDDAGAVCSMRCSSSKVPKALHICERAEDRNTCPESDDRPQKTAERDRHTLDCSVVDASAVASCMGWVFLERLIGWLSDAESAPSDIDPVMAWSDLLDSTSSVSDTMDGTAYRIALHMMVTCEYVPLAVFGRLCKILENEVFSYSSKGIRYISQALLVKDLETLGGLRDPSVLADGRVGCMIVSSDGLLSAQTRMLSEGSPLRRFTHRGRTTRVTDTSAEGHPDRPPSVDSARASLMAPAERNALRKPVVGVGGAEAPYDDIPMMRVDMFGGLDIYLGGEPIVAAQWRRRKMRHLIAMLVLHKGKEVSRDKVFEELWPGSDCERSRDNWYVLWSTYNKMMRSLGLEDVPYVIRTDSTCKVNMRLVSSDVFEFEEISRRIIKGGNQPEVQIALCSRMEELYRGDLLSSEFGGEDFEPMRIWYRNMFVDAMVTASGDAVTCNESQAAMWFARKAYEFGIAREDVYRALMRAQLHFGQRSSAKMTYDLCCEYLSDQLGVTLSNETTSFYEQFIAPRFPDDGQDDGDDDEEKDRNRGKGKGRAKSKG